jgi:hypothetical protein
MAFVMLLSLLPGEPSGRRAAGKWLKDPPVVIPGAPQRDAVRR